MMIEENAKNGIIQRVIDRCNQKHAPDEAKLISQFVGKLYSTAAIDDLSEKKIDDLYGAVISHWKFILERKSNETKIKVFNPNYERDGWESTHTVILVVQEDMPFLVDSLRMEVNNQNLYTHLVIHTGGLKVKRNKDGLLTDILSNETNTEEVFSEATIYMEIDRQTDATALDNLNANLYRVLDDVRAAVDDWPAMRARVRESLDELENVKNVLDPHELAESKDFLRWIENDHFTFLGARDYHLTEEKGEKALKITKNSGLGVLHEKGEHKPLRILSSMSPEARKLALSSQILIISKTNTKATVHRPVYSDYIGIKRFDAKGNVIGERRIVGLYTSAAYNTNPKNIPFLRRKVTQVLKNSNLAPNGHSWKALLNILETFPRDDLFQASVEELTEFALGILHLQERQRIRMFARKDVYGRFISCLVYVPRDRYNTLLRMAMQDVLVKAFQASESTFFTYFSESILARIHFILRIDPKKQIAYDFKKIEGKLIEVGRAWEDDLREYLLDYYGEEKGNKIARTYANAFLASYKESYTARVAVYDIAHIENLSDTNTLEMHLYRPIDASGETLHFKLFQKYNTIPLSDVLPILENMGLRAISENPNQIRLSNGSVVWINDFGLVHKNSELIIDIERVSSVFQEAFKEIWYGHAEDDALNYLVLSANLKAKEVTILRAYSKYLRQIGFTFSQDYIAEAIVENPTIASLLVELFKLRFDPALSESEHKEKCATTLEVIYEKLNMVANLDKDRIFRRFLALILATVRTNYFQSVNLKTTKSYLSFKFNSGAIPELPLPHPLYEIFTYSPRFEGIHLRSSKVARGGIRWSDRREDFRTEVLGLMKAQVVKNAVIVPSGAKGGFVPKLLPVSGTRDELMQEVISCYQDFIRSMLTITDDVNKNGQIVPPKDVVRYDEDDSYLVVAADKGTATFSDIANEISLQSNYWLGDAFASGGKTGYDHKKIGITARGAWESVKRHFRELGINTQTTDFTVIGIGDMAGDVFGNGMLLSPHIKLIAAFNHQHIFLDPTPEPFQSFKERERLFNLPRTTWEDYDIKLISEGGGVFNRAAKSILLTPQLKSLLEINEDSIVPNDLIKKILAAKVDLFWNGGIGTFVKSSHETHLDVGDRTNDAIRINGVDLNCRVVAEGGNLGFTQLGRIEYAVNGGIINTDFIDNSAGVDCSDHEVNLKILLNKIVENGDITEKQRNKLLASMTEDVAQLVLSHNYAQVQAISLSEMTSSKNIELYARYIKELEREGKINRALEFLPDEKTLLERKTAKTGLSRPVIAILLAYSKSILKEDILKSEVPEDTYLCTFLKQAFPEIIQNKFPQQMDQHILRREIIATQLSNTMINEMGFTFVHRLRDETGASVSAIVRAYTVARKLFHLSEIWRDIEAADYKVNCHTQAQMMEKVTRLVRRSSRWFLRNRRLDFEISAVIKQFSPGLKQINSELTTMLATNEKVSITTIIDDLVEQGVDLNLATNIAYTNSIYAALDIIDASSQYKLDLTKVATIYYMVGEQLDLDWMREHITNHSIESHWEALVREALRDDLDWQQRNLAISILQYSETDKPLDEVYLEWCNTFSLLVDRWQGILNELRGSITLNYTMYSVAIRELLDLTQASSQAAKAEKEKKQKK